MILLWFQRPTGGSDSRGYFRILEFKNFTGTFLLQLQMEVKIKNNESMVQHVNTCQHAKNARLNVQIKFLALEK